MNILTLDFETYFDDEYTLKKMTTEAYVRDPRFEALGCGARWPDGTLQWYEDPRDIFEDPKFPHCAVLCHHAHFDLLIASHHYNARPKAILDTLSMARLMLGNHISVGLESLARHYGLQGKSVPYDRMRGRHWADMDAGLRSELAAGCLHDIELTWQIFCKLMRGERS